jgi:hypothetical protein
MFVDLTVRKRMLFDNIIIAADRSCNTGLLLRTYAQIPTILHVTYVSPNMQNLDNHLKTTFNLHDI